MRSCAAAAAAHARSQPHVAVLCTAAASQRHHCLRRGACLPPWTVSPPQDATLELKVRTVKYFRGLAAMEDGVDAAQRTTRGRAHSGALDYPA